MTKTILLSEAIFLLLGSLPGCAPSGASAESDVPRIVSTDDVQGDAKAEEKHNLPKAASHRPSADFPAPPGTYHYEVVFDIVSLTTDQNGDLTENFSKVRDRGNQLISDASRFDLTRKKDLNAYGNYVGKELMMKTGKSIRIVIRQTGKDLFSGELKAIEPGEFELIETSKQKRLTIAEFRKALELFEGGKCETDVSFSKKGQSVKNLIKIGDLLGKDSPLATKGIVNGLHETIQALRKASEELEYMLLFPEETPSITSVEQKLGDEPQKNPGGFFIASKSHLASRIEKGKVENSSPLTWHTYDWVDFGVVHGKVVAQRIDLRKYPSADHSLTYDTVRRNVDTYVGKRVAWVARFATWNTRDQYAYTAADESGAFHAENLFLFEGPCKETPAAKIASNAAGDALIRLVIGNVKRKAQMTDLKGNKSNVPYLADVTFDMPDVDTSWHYVKSYATNPKNRYSTSAIKSRLETFISIYPNTQQAKEAQLLLREVK
jgi:hypothetical protein